MTDTAAAAGNSARLAAAAGNNDVHLVYVTSTGVFYQKRLSGVWQAAVTLSGAVNGGAPVIAVDDDSPRNVHVAWHEYAVCGAECDWELYYARSTDDGATFPPSPKSNFSRNQYTSYDPAVTARGSKIVMTWQENVNGAHPDIVFSRSNDNGTTWDAPPEVPVATPTAYNTAVFTPTRTSTPTPGAGATWTPSPTPTAVTIGSGITKYYYFGAQRIAMRNSTGLYYFHGDQLGSTSLVTNNSGVLVSRQTYYPFGLPRTSEGTSLTSLTDFTFTGQKVDVSTGLMFYGARYYDAELGRFTQADTIVPNSVNPQNLNRYAYTVNNPVRYTDPTGHDNCDHETDWCDRYYNALGLCWSESKEAYKRECDAIIEDKDRLSEVAESDPEILTDPTTRFLFTINDEHTRVDIMQVFGLTLVHQGLGEFDVLLELTTFAARISPSTASFVNDLTISLVGWSMYAAPFCGTYERMCPTAPNSLVGALSTAGVYQRGFAKMYQDPPGKEDSQARHFWEYVAIGFFYGPSVASVGNQFHEATGTMNSIQDLNLGMMGARLGFRLSTLYTTPGQVRDWIYYNLSEDSFAYPH